jgi:hypothetical protein
MSQPFEMPNSVLSHTVRMLRRGVVVACRGGESITVCPRAVSLGLAASV